MYAAGTPRVLASEHSLSMSGGPHLGLGSGFATGDQCCLSSALGDVPREPQGRPERLPFPYFPGGWGRNLCPLKYTGFKPWALE